MVEGFYALGEKTISHENCIYFGLEKSRMNPPIARKDLKQS